MRTDLAPLHSAQNCMICIDSTTIGSAANAMNNRSDFLPQRWKGRTVIDERSRELERVCWNVHRSARLNSSVCHVSKMA